MKEKIIAGLLACCLCFSAGCHWQKNTDTAKKEPPVQQPSVDPAAATTTKPQQKKAFEVDDVLLVNQHHPLPKNYAPESFADVGNGQTLTPEAAAAYQELAKACLAETNRTLVPLSGYRSYAYQEELFNNYKNVDGQDAEHYSAKPGTSEHQTGLAIDVGDIDLPEENLEESFGETEAGKWLAENATDFGFILRYLKGQETFTGYQYEPWHFRFVGKDVAKHFKKDDTLTLEAYLGDTTSYPQGFDNQRRIAEVKSYQLVLDQHKEKITAYNVKNRVYIPLRTLSVLSQKSEHPFNLLVSKNTGRIRLQAGTSDDSMPDFAFQNGHRSTVILKTIPLFFDDGSTQKVKTFVVKGHTYVQLHDFLNLLNWELTAEDDILTIKTKEIPQKNEASVTDAQGA